MPRDFAWLFLKFWVFGPFCPIVGQKSPKKGKNDPKKGIMGKKKKNFKKKNVQVSFQKLLQTFYKKE